MWYYCKKKISTFFFCFYCLMVFASDWTKCQHSSPGGCRADGQESLLELKPLDSMGVQEACTKRLKGTEQKPKNSTLNQGIDYKMQLCGRVECRSELWRQLSTFWCFLLFVFFLILDYDTQKVCKQRGKRCGSLRQRSAWRVGSAWTAFSKNGRQENISRIIQETTYR